MLAKLNTPVVIDPRTMTVVINLAYVFGTALLLLGAWYYDQYDWDYGLSLVMAGITYLTIPRLRWNLLSVFYWWLAVDGSYWLYNMARGVDVNDLRLINFIASSSLYSALLVLEVLRRLGRAKQESNTHLASSVQPLSPLGTQG